MLTQRYDNDHIEHTSYVLVASLFFAGDGPTSLRAKGRKHWTGQSFFVLVSRVGC